MPRPTRYQPAGGMFHVTTRGNRGQPIFLEDADRLLFLRLLGRVERDAQWQPFAWCLMTNHFHLVLRTPTETLASGMQRLNGVYARRFNAKHLLEHHLFGRRYDARFIRDERSSREPCGTWLSIQFEPVCANTQPIGAGPAS